MNEPSLPTNQSSQIASTVCLLGIGGAGMRGLALLYAAQGMHITGTDYAYDVIKAQPDLARYDLAAEESADSLVHQADIVVYSDALTIQHPLRVLAVRLGKKILSYQEAVGDLSKKYRTIAITGTHGKSSTTAFLAHIAIAAGLDPTVLLGATTPSWGSNARVGRSNLFIVEADEYREHFLYLHPHDIILTTLDFDHPDFFNSITEVKNAYQKFINLLPTTGSLTTSQTIVDGYKDFKWPAAIHVMQQAPTGISLALPGEHMQYNAGLTIEAADKLFGITPDQSRRYLESFNGISRRFETIMTTNTFTLISDYGHHPTEIAATLQAAREKYPTAKIATLIEPHTSERLTALFPEFKDVLAVAPVDGIGICPVFLAKGRRTHNAAISSQTLYESLQSTSTIPVWQLNTYAELPALLQALEKDYEVVISFTAGELDNQLRLYVKSRAY